MEYINDIVKKAVLLDSNGIDEEKVKSNNSLFMHSLYAVANIGNGPEVIRLYVEEINNPNTKDTAKRAYQIQNIEKVFPASGKVQGNTPSFVTNTENTIDTIADLVAVVKSRNKSFERAKVSVIVNKDGTPKILYHQTTEDFTVFDPKHPGAGQFDSELPAGVYMKETPDTLKLGKKYESSKQMALYAAIRNPLHARMRELLDRYMADSP